MSFDRYPYLSKQVTWPTHGEYVLTPLPKEKGRSSWQQPSICVCKPKRSFWARLWYVFF